MHSMKKICILLPSLVGGGAERLHILLAKSWLDQSYSVDFLVLDNQKVAGALESLVPQECRVFVLKETRLRKAIFPIAKVLKKEGFDLMVAPMWPMSIIAIIARFLSLSKTRIVVSDHTHLSTSRESELKVPLFILRASIGIFYRFANAIVCVSKGVRDDIAYLGLLNKKKIKVIYNPVAIKGYRKKTYNSEEIARIWPSDFPNRILSAGSLIAQKNYTLLIKAFSMLPSEILSNSQLVILGGGLERDSLESLIKELELQERIFLLGFQLDPMPWFETASLFVLSSNWEGFGNVLVEALQSSLPIVSTDCKSGPSEILEDGKYGKLVEMDNPAALSSAIAIQLEENHDPQILYGRSQEFTIDKASVQYLDLFKELSI